MFAKMIIKFTELGLNKRSNLSATCEAVDALMNNRKVYIRKF